MKSFIDTNILIAYIFHIDSLHYKANQVFEEYQTIIYSQKVKLEADFVFTKKRKILQEFFENLLMETYNKNANLSSLKDLKKLISNKKFNKMIKGEIKSSLEPFWVRYVKEQFPKNEIIQQAIFNCLNDLDIYSFNRKEQIEKRIKITERRMKPYAKLHKKLKEMDVHHPDDEIILDVHDHNLRINDKLDFITFDNGFYNRILKIKEFSFHDIKGKNDFYTSYRIKNKN